MRSIRTALVPIVLGLALAGATAAPATAAPSFPRYFAGGDEGTTQAAAQAGAAAEANADKAAYEAETGTTCTVLNTSGGAHQLGPNWWGAYVLIQARCA
jgi:hypothetical protein